MAHDYFAEDRALGCWLLIRGRNRTGFHGPGCTDRTHLDPLPRGGGNWTNLTPHAEALKRRLYCAKGHPLSKSNTFRRPGSHGRGCRTCAQELKEKSKRKRRMRWRRKLAMWRRRREAKERRKAENVSRGT